MNNSIVKIIDVNVNEIIPNRFQPRRQFDEDEIIELSESIRKYGVIQPLVVRPIADKYEIIAGERRYKASVLAGLDYVPVIVKNLTDKDSAELAIIENIQRRNLSAIEEALSYKKVLDMGYLTQEELAAKLGKSQPTIANKIRLLNLSDEVQEALLENKISERHARSLLRLTTGEKQNEMLNKIIQERLTVRKTDEEIDKIKEIESGENNMNEMPVMPQMPTEPAAPSQPEFTMPQMPTEPAAPSQPEFMMPQMPTEPVAPSQPEFTMPQIPNEPAAPSQPEFMMPQMPTEPAAPSQLEFMMPQMPTEPVAPSQPEFTMPQIPTEPAALSQPEVQDRIPATSPIIEQPIAPVQAEPTMPQIPVSEPEPVVPTIQETIAEPISNVNEPIIITDYSKQYDPVMPNAPQPVEKVDFKEVISAIRECSSKIEQYGYVIDVEEYDLANLYQVVFKVEK